MKPLLVQEGDPEPNKGLLNTQEPHYTIPLNIAFLTEYLRLSMVPSIFYVGGHLWLHLLWEDSSVSMAFAQESDAFTQVAFTLLIMIHCGVRHLSFIFQRNVHRQKVVNEMQLRGNETILDIKCSKGFWTCGVAEKLKAGGRIFAMDMWDTDATPYDGQWTVENSRREEVSGRVEVLNYGDPHFMVFKDNAFDCTLCAWLETEDEVNFYNLLSEMVRVTRPGGRLLFIMPKHPPHLLKHNLKDLGVKDIEQKMITTAYLMSNFVCCEKPESYEMPPARIDRSENAVTDESPGFDIKMLYFLGAVGFYFVAVYTVIIKMSWTTWLVPKDVAEADSLAYGFMAENSVWLCWAIVDMHFILASRPKYIVKRIGVVNLWLGFFCQFFLMVIIFNMCTWAPLLLFATITGVKSVAVRCIFRVVARPCIGFVLDDIFSKRRQQYFLQTWKEDYGSLKNRYRKPRKSKRKKRETDMLLDDLEGLGGPEAEDTFAPGI